jgi:hypothetical protein
MADVDEINLRISKDDAIVLFEFFERFDEKARLYFVHPSEYISLMKISRQVDKSISAMFKSNLGKLLQEARERTAKGFECNFPVLEKE